jgi:hypothetical protein
MTNSQPFVFILMPFGHEFDELERAIKEAATRAHCTPERVDHQKFSGEIVDKICSNIDSADVIVAVATGGRPNVFYEIGLAHAIYKHVILVIDDARNMPFDLSHFRLLQPFCASDDGCIERLREEIEWCRDNPSEQDGYYQEFKKALCEVQAHATRELAPFFRPMAKKFFDEWCKYIERIVREGDAMLGPDRLDITRAITLATKEYALIERFPENPREIHTAAWQGFYATIGAQKDIKKRWTLCIEPGEVVTHRARVKLAWTFFHELDFATRYLAPGDYTDSTGNSLPDAHVIESFGDFIKLLRFAGAGYKSGPKSDALHTTIRKCEPDDTTMLSLIDDCSREIDMAWIDAFHA